MVRGFSHFSQHNFIGTGERSSFGRIWSDFTHLWSCGIATGLNPGVVPPETVLSHRSIVYSHLQFWGRGVDENVPIESRASGKWGLGWG